MKQLVVLHPCQHLVGSVCWATVPDEQKDKCPVCKVDIQSKEKEMIKITDVQDFVIDKETKRILSLDDVKAMINYMNVRARLPTDDGSLREALAPIDNLTPTQQDRLVLFLTNVPRSDQDSDRQKIGVALSAFNISHDTKFTLTDLKKMLSTASDWITGHFAAILQDDKDDDAKRDELLLLLSTLRGDKDAAVRADLKELKHDHQPWESALRLQEEIRMAVGEIGKRADKQTYELYAEAMTLVKKIFLEVQDEVRKFWAQADEDIATLEDCV